MLSWVAAHNAVLPLLLPATCMCMEHNHCVASSMAKPPLAGFVRQGPALTEPSPSVFMCMLSPSSAPAFVSGADAGDSMNIEGDLVDYGHIFFCS